MEKLIINGGNPLSGEVEISGAKNAAVAILPATLLVKGECVIENVPSISDVKIIFEMLSVMGAKVERINDTSVRIDTTGVDTYVATEEYAVKMRASYYFLGALMGRMRRARVPLPGGCDLGPRPIDQHKKGFESLGCEVNISHGVVDVNATNLSGGNVYLDVVSVGATINIMLAAALAPGNTIIENAAKEPHIVDVANFLNSMGANIRGAGTDIIKIKGVESLHGGTYSIIPDQIEAGTYMFAALATRENVLIKNVIPKHLEAISAKFVEMGATVEEGDEDVRVSVSKPLKHINVKTLPYPGFPTDLQPLMVTALTMVDGESKVIESVWDSRFKYTAELNKMGADIDVYGETAVINGVSGLTGALVKATDLRAGAALVVAGLAAKGTTTVTELRHIDRGYENLENKLIALGADIKRVDE